MQGSHATQEEIIYANAKVMEIDAELGGLGFQARVIQGREPSHFLQLFKGKLIVFKGKGTDFDGRQSNLNNFLVKFLGFRIRKKSQTPSAVLPARLRLDSGQQQSDSDATESLSLEFELLLRAQARQTCIYLVRTLLNGGSERNGKTVRRQRLWVGFGRQRKTGIFRHVGRQSSVRDTINSKWWRREAAETVSLLQNQRSI